MKLKITTLVIVEEGQVQDIYHSLEDNQDKAYQEIIDQVNAEYGDGGVLQFYSLQGIKECITAPVLTLDPTKPEPIKRAEMILENFSQEDSPVVATVIAPGNFIQMILPKHEILLSVMFIYKERNTYVQLIIQKLAYEREKITTKTNGSVSSTEG